jgi:hypothetical protein
MYYTLWIENAVMETNLCENIVGIDWLPVFLKSCGIIFTIDGANQV